MMIFLTIFSLSKLLVQIENPMGKIGHSRKTLIQNPLPASLPLVNILEIFKASCMYEPINMRTSNPTDPAF
jgi:hypothetical protein